MPCRINVFSGRKRENPPKCDFRVAGRKVAMRKHESHHLAGFRVAPFRPENTIIRHGTNQPPYLDILFLTFIQSVLSTRQAIMPFILVKSDTSLTFRSTCVDLWRTCQGEQNPLCNIRRRKKYPRGKFERAEMSGW